MTQEEKQLLIKDICARLPYNIKLGFENSNVILIPKDYCYFTQQLFSTLVFPEHNGTVEYGYPIYEYRPYLRPMRSMTDEERLYFHRNSSKVDILVDEEKIITKPFYGYTIHLFDWLNAHHFDYHNLIEKSLAIVAPEGMYKTE